ncbi:MAG: hypothetical protein EOO09_14495 [Chitinophagaceae bacterium]|nr:MAG: hypothetical protein EOO09_14495 [Chitinophagaceae bacterium]
MKQLFSFLVFTLLVTVAGAQGGRIKVTFVGFDCFRETWDDILHTDGKGDEVYFNFNFIKSGKTGNLINKFDKRTQVYGDATGPFSNRVSAGSMTDMFGGNKGGIRGGDQFRTSIVVGEMDLADGDFVVLTPTAWEHDPIADNSNSFFSTMGSMYTSVTQKLAPIMLTLNALHGNFAGVIFNATQLGLPKVRAGGEQGELGRAGTRPIGMEKYGDFTTKFVALNSRTIQEFVNTDAGYGPGVISINYNEEEAGNSRDHGNYTILLKVEWKQASGNSGYVPPPATGSNGNTSTASAPPPPPASSNTGSTRAVPPPPASSNTGSTRAVPPPPANTGIRSSAAANAATKATPPAPVAVTKTAAPANPGLVRSIAPAPAGAAPSAGAPPTEVKANTPVRAANLNKLNNTTLPVRAAAAGPSIVGKWEGIQSNDLGPDNVQFEMLESGEFIIRSAKGAVTGKGTYSLKGNNFYATGTQFSSKETVSFAGTYDAATGQLSVNAGSKGKGTLVRK